MLWIILGIITSYILGSIPTAYIFAKLLKGVDIRKVGSGNVGATNALRVLGKGPGIAVLFVDILKGFLAVILLGDIFAAKVTSISQDTLRIILGLGCISGHNWTLFLGFKGGKGVATTLGVLLGLSLKIASLKFILGLVILTWFVVFFTARIVSLASVVSSIALPAYTFLLDKESRVLLVLSILLCALSIIRHKSNLKRIFKGEEPRLKL